LGNTANSRTVYGTAIFAAAPSTTPSPNGLTSVDIGAVGGTGTVAYDSGTDNYTFVASGTDVWDTTDQCRYAYTTNSGDIWFNTQVLSLENTDGWAKAGVMVRESTATGAREVSMIVNPGGQTQFQYRDTANGVTYAISGPVVAFPHWMELDVVGDTISGYISTDGWYENLTLVGSVTMSMPTYLMGIVLTSHNNSLLNTAVFHALQIGGWGAAASPGAAAAILAGQSVASGDTTVLTPVVQRPLVPIAAPVQQCQTAMAAESKVDPLSNRALDLLAIAQQARIRAAKDAAPRESSLYSRLAASVFDDWI
jgi:hypothetical protein